MLLDDARRYLLNLLPPGAERLYDLSPSTGDVYKLFGAWAQAFKQYAFDLADLLRTELFPPTVKQKLPDWEAAAGIASEYPAVFGSTAARQSALLAKLRESGPFCDPVVQSVLAPLLGYFPTTVPQIFKVHRANLDAAHTYTTGRSFAGIANGATITDGPLLTPQGGIISKAGARLLLTFSGVVNGSVSVTLTGPDGLAKTWTFNPMAASARLFGAEWAGRVAYPLGGYWKLSLTNNTGGAISLNSWAVIVDGIAPNQDTGGAIFNWGVYADPAHLSENGVPADFGSARRAIARIKHSHTNGHLIQSITPYPDTQTGANAAIPDECLPV